MTDVYCRLTLLGFLLSYSAQRVLLLGQQRPEGRPLWWPQLLLIGSRQELVPVEEAVGDGQQAGVAAIVLAQYACVTTHMSTDSRITCERYGLYHLRLACAWLHCDSAKMALPKALSVCYYSIVDADRVRRCRTHRGVSLLWVRCVKGETGA